MYLGKTLYPLHEALPSDSTCIRKALPGKLDIKRHSPSIHLVFSMYTCRFAPDLKTLAYVGDKEKREEMAQRIKADRAKGKLNFQVLITTYEVKYY